MDKKYDLDLLLKEINEEKTLASVKHYLMVDFPRLQRIAQLKPGEIKSPSMDGMPNTHSAGNHVADGIDRVLIAQEAVWDTVKAIKRCSADSRQLLWAVYVEHKSDTPVMLDLHMRHSNFYDKTKKLALFEFADAFMAISDLHVYMDDA